MRRIAENHLDSFAIFQGKRFLQYLMNHSDIGVTLNTYTHLGLEDAAEELRRMEEAEAARREQEKLAGKANDSQKLFKAV
jgi:integrase